MLELERRRRPVPAPGLEPGRDQAVVVVARDEDELRVSDRSADLHQQRPGAAESLADRILTQLERVAQQHHAVGSGERLQQPCPRRPGLQQVGASPRPQVQVRDDQRPHAGAGP